MYVHVKPTTKQRILAFFMAFAIIFVSLPYLGVDKGVRVNALSGTDVITTNTTETHYSDFTSITSDSIYNYNGKIQASTKVSVFDYVSDAEFASGAGWSYNNLEHTAPYGGYDDAFTAFNNAIASTGTVKSSSNNNTTIKFKSTQNKCTRAYVHFWNTTSINTTWPGIPMVFNPSDNCFYLTVPNSVLGTNSPTFKINGGKNGDGNDTWQSGQKTIDQSGKQYYCELDEYDRFIDKTNYNHADYIPWIKDDASAQPLYYSAYDYPLYFGCFYLGDTASDYSTKKALYDKFYWQPNISIRGSGDDASVQNLVYDTLSGGSKTGNLLSSNNQELPYFSTTWADTGSNSTYIKYYNQSGAGDSYIAFPFYEALADASNSNIAGTNKSSSTAKAKFYEFNSAKTNLQFVGDAGTHTGYFKESTTQINSNWGRQGFFPFNTTNNSKKNNLGFGMKFEMNFKLQKDGCVGVVNSSGEDLKYDATTQPERINTIFEFEGDDDLWVYLDGHLILDLGGSHFKSKGKIDFAQKTAVAYEAIEIGDGQGVDDLDPASDRTNPRQLSVSTSDFTTILGDTYNTDDYPNQYDPTKTHTITVFYMERGMGDSNLMIRYNYKTENNFSKMKIQEVTDFSDVNTGLIPATKKAADYDVFEYTTLNTGTNKKEDVKDSALLYPTNSETHTRDVQSGDSAHSLETILTSTSNTTSQTGGNFLSDKADTYTSNNDAVKNTNYYWVDNFAGMDKINSIDHKGVGRTDSNGRMYLMYGTAKNTDKNTDDIEVSGEFIKQFKRSSTMQITQGTKLYSPNRSASPVATLNNNNVRGSNTLVDSYYTTTVSLNDYNFTNTWTLANGDTFVFNNGDGTSTPGKGDHVTTAVDSNTDVMMTETFTNKIRVGAITITKAKASNDPDSITSGKSFKIKVRFEDVFGVTGVNGDADADYSSIKYKVYSSNGTVQNNGNPYDMEVSTTAGGDKCGTITLEVNQTATIEGIPVGTKYYIYEEEPKYKPDPLDSNGVISSGTVVEGEIKTIPSASPKSQSPTGAGGAYQNNANNATVTNYSNSLTIKEVTDFSTVNSGLLNYTKKAAENDVFKYTVSNNGTTNSDVVDSGILAPTTDTYTRSNQSISTQLTGASATYEDDLDHVYLDTSTVLSGGNRWDDDPDVGIVVYLYQDGIGGKTFVSNVEKIAANLYKIDIKPDLSYDYNCIHFYRVPNSYINDTNNNFPLVNLSPKNQFEKNLSGKPAFYHRYTLGFFSPGATYEIIDWGNGRLKDLGPYQIEIPVTTSTHNYTPGDNPSGSVAVANTNYEWKDEFASNTPFTNTTGDDGELYLMHGTVLNAAALTENKESSATFYNQFKRDNNSIMTVEQVNTLYSPDRTQTPDALGSTGQRTSNTLGTYYTMSKSLSGSQTAFSPADSNSFVYNDLNANKSVRITETFKNTVNVGSISITKALDPNDDLPNREFEFQLTLTKVFGTTGTNQVNVASNGYDGIKASLDGGAASDSYIDANGKFKLKKGQILVISGIPVGTEYTIVETVDDEYDIKSITKDSVTATNISGTISDNHTDAFVVTNARKVGSLTLSKSLYAYTGATVNGDTGYTFQVTLIEPEGVTFANNYMTTGANASRIVSGNYNSGTKTYTFYETVKSKDGGSVTIEDIPYGTQFTVTEISPTGNPIVEYSLDGTPTVNSISGTIEKASTVANVTNTYRKVTMTKTDANDSSFGVEGATYYLLRLKPGSTSGTYAADENPTAAQTEFESTSTYTTFNSSTYFEVCSGTTPIATGSGGTLTLLDSGVTNGLKPGKYIFFEETAPYGYTKDNSYNSNKIITITDSKSTLEYSKTNNDYTNTRKKGTLTLYKTVTLGSGTTLPSDAADKGFAYDVTLTGPSGLDLSNFSVSGTDSSNNAVNLGTLTNNSYHFTVTVHSSDTNHVTFTNLPYGTTYSVYESSTLPSSISTDSDSTAPVSGEIGEGGTKVVNATATITNTYNTGSLTISKNIAGDSTNTNYFTDKGFTFTVTLTPETSDFVDLSKYSFTDSTSKITNTSYDHKTITLQLKHGESTTIGNIPLGTKYTVAETDPSDESTVTYQINSGTAVNSQYSTTGTNAITSTSPQTVAFTNTYSTTPTPVTGEPVTVVKTDENGNTIDSPAEFDLWYRDSTKHPTYTFNDPLTAPLRTTAFSVSGTGITVPDAAPATDYTTYEYTYTFNAPTTPTATETKWILPRTDNDYIYFRDFESGTADHDPGLSKHAWLNTWFEPNTTSGVHGQDQEIGYDHKYWVAAQFRKSDNSGFVEYAVWERFVDKITDSGNNYNTIVWKIQPPDGYSKVRFCLYDGSECIRTTTEFEYKLGNVYQKTGWGSSYAYKNGKHCYYSVPVDSGTNWSTYYATTSSSMDKRLTGSDSSMYQAERYTPTEQKIIFHCNSQQVWHNIHIEFFSDSSGNNPVGQKFPGYMMEPYAYAGSNYRLSNGYLTYELTIPKEARYFRINNGVSLTGDSPYAYRTNIQQISTTGNKNYNNYYILGDNINSRYDCLSGGSPRIAQLSQAASAITGLSNESTNVTYSSTDVESDCDYIYFAKKKTGSSWNDHIYAYFYGGGNLREDNWQRACYSIWPGVAPVGSQFNDGSDHNSTIYDYTPSANPESTFEITKGSTAYTVYKFRLPEGDRKNYSKVIFNDGLSKHSGGKETSPITYNAGYIYYEDGGSKKHFENYSTEQYTARGGADDYLYIKTSDSSWDDMHITFYDANGTQIHQGGKGYVMNYSGTSGSDTYYRIAIPNDAAKFKLNNGMDKSTSLETDFGDILRKSDYATEGNKKSDYTDGIIVYTLDNTNKLTMEPLFTKTETSTTHTSGVQNSNIDYAYSRGDKLNIRNTAGWNIGIGGGQVKFYDSNGVLITGDESKGNGTYILIKTDNDSGSSAKEWYTIDIPDNAASFTLTYNNGANTTARNPIYPKSAGADGNYTEGGMYYETTSGGALSLMTTTVSPATAETDITAAKRGDTLYLLYTSKTEWENMTVTFKNSSGADIIGATNIEANYIAQKGSDYWWSISIPTGAASFTVTKDSSTTTAAGIYPLSTKLSRYKKDYTLGDMQYRLPNPAESSKPGLLYPKFTQDDEYTLTVGGKTLTTASGTALVDETAIANYANANAVTTPATSGNEPTSPYPVLYSTTTDKLTYSWTEGAEDTNIYFEKPSTWSGTPKIYLYNSASNANTTWDGSPLMTYVSDNIYKYDVGNNNWQYVIFRDGDNDNNRYPADGVNWDISGYNYGKGKIARQISTTTVPALVLNVTDFQTITLSGLNASFYTSDNDSTWISNVRAQDYREDMTLGAWFAIPNGAAYVKFYQNDSSYNFSNSSKTALTNGGTDQGFKLSSDGNSVSTFTLTPSQLSKLHEYAGSTSTWSIDSYFGDGTSTTTYTATYQPEDRYGFITSRDDYSSTPADTNNFIYIETEIPDPYITFYDSSSNVIGGNDMADAGIKLKGVCGNSASPYKIRLPRNAKSFKLADGASGILGTAIPLEETIYVKSDGTVTNSTDTSGTEITDYRHAGTTFTATSTNSVTVKTLRSGFTISRDTEISKASPKSDIDYVFFTDTSDTIKGTDGTVYAYFYGSADGEFAQWPGIQAESSYIDNAGNTVYRFRIPKGTNGTYTKVIFNNGSNTGRKITQAVDATGGKNYTLDTTPTAQYGTDGTNAINAYAVSGTPKAAAGSAAYGSNRYIYIYNNGTQNLTSGQTVSDTTDRYKLDEMHVIFYDINNAPIGPASTGYIPDKLSIYTDYYRMQVPNGAVYFQITNGEGKGSGSNYYSRQSEIKQITANGLYEFVSGKTNAADYITADSTVPTDAETRQNPKYLLTLSNEKKAELDDDVPETSTFDVKLAVVVTGEGGTQKYIKWLRQVNGEVDQAYLNHTNVDVGEDKNVTTVKVVKNGTYYWKEVVAPAGYELNENTFEFVKNESTTSTVTTTVTDKKISGKVILTKKAKEKVGTTNIGDPLAGAVFKVFKSDGTTVTGFTGTYTTDSEGKLTIEGLSPGDYYLEEQTAPAGFVATDSNNSNAKKKVYFSVGDNTTTKYLTCSDEMAPAYIKLYEHINEKLPAWGDPTFIFKITQTKYANDTDVPAANQRTHIVALTVDDDGKFTTDTVLGSDYNGWYQESTDELEGESPKKREYQGMYHIDSEGKIRLEPGTYSITRVPVSRYEFVADTWKLEDDTTANIYTTNKHTETNQTMTGSEPAIQNVTIPQGKTALVHYYDKVAYYDKFSHVDTKINQFYKLDGDKNNTTAKGIRVEYKPKVGTDVTEADINITNNDDFKAWFINVDGTERAMNDSDKAKLVISCLPTDNNNADTLAFLFQSPTIKISTPSNFKDKVYTLTAEYKENNQTKFTTKFDLVFERSS